MNTQQVQRPVDMINNVHLGTWMEWKDIVSLVPNRWVYLTDYRLDDKTQDEDMIDSLKLEKDEILISGITVFADDSIKA